jgi:hypothetical protein
MIMLDSNVGMGAAGKWSRPPRGGAVLAMPDVGLDFTRWIQSVSEVTLGAGEQ